MRTLNKGKDLPISYKDDVIDVVTKLAKIITKPSLMGMVRKGLKEEQAKKQENLKLGSTKQMTSYLNLNKPIVIQVELTTKCNAMCPMCARVDDRVNGQYFKPICPFEADMKFETWTNFLIVGH